MAKIRSCDLYVGDRPIPYLQAWQWQKALVRARQGNPDFPDALILLEHPPVYTLGQGSSSAFLKFDPAALQSVGIACHRVERGGEVTYHAPGQLVGYPILNLNAYQRDLHWYLRQLEEVLIRLLVGYQLPATRVAGMTGVWLADRKIAQVGIKVGKWITMHGFSLNVRMDMSGFERIVPCGISDRGVCQLAEFLPEITMAAVKDAAIAAFREVFNVDFLLRSLPPTA